MTKICDFPYPIYEGGGHDKEVASSKKVHSRLQCKNRYPIYDQNGWKTLPFGAAHTYIAHIREYPPPPGYCPFFLAHGLQEKLD